MYLCSWSGSLLLYNNFIIFFGNTESHISIQSQKYNSVLIVLTKIISQSSFSLSQFVLPGTQEEGLKADFWGKGSMTFKPDNLKYLTNKMVYQVTIPVVFPPWLDERCVCLSHFYCCPSEKESEYNQITRWSSFVHP